MIAGVRWFTGRTTVGIVKVVDKNTNEVKYYISAVQGLDEKLDIQFIAEYGTKFPNDAGDVLFNY